MKTYKIIENNRKYVCYVCSKEITNFQKIKYKINDNKYKFNYFHIGCFVKYQDRNKKTIENGVEWAKNNVKNYKSKLRAQNSFLRKINKDERIAKGMVIEQLSEPPK